MCRWLAYAGSPILLPDVLCTPAQPLIDQSLHSKHDRNERRRGPAPVESPAAAGNRAQGPSSRQEDAAPRRAATGG